jgi:Asp-tRNA(Asn)/Glu-tRNA(Gln) amidotransferase A subunit family amidase
MALMTQSEYVAHDAHSLAALIRSKTIDASEVLDAALVALDETHEELNAVAVRTQALARRDLTQLNPEAPFAGVPFLLKDSLQPLAGYPMAEGNRTQANWIPDSDGELVRRLRAAGFLIIGKTNVPEYCLLPTTEPALHGPTRNPWDSRRTTGGSSGGSAAAVAGRIVPVAHGSDAGGSIRIPASCCGVFGLKPTRGRVSDGPLAGAVWGGLNAEGVITRSVRDSAALLDLFRGNLPGDPYTLAPPERPFLAEVGASTGHLRVALLTKSPVGTDVHPDCVKAARDAAALCESLGHSITEIELPGDPGMIFHFLAIYVSTAALARNETARRIGCAVKEVELEPFTAALASAGDRVSGPQYMEAWEYFYKLSRTIGGLMLNFDMLLTPTLGDLPVRLGTFEPPADDPLSLAGPLASFNPFCTLANVTGHPAMSVPLYWNTEGLPVGVQFIGRFGDEAGLFRLASQLESALPWADKTPRL